MKKIVISQPMFFPWVGMFEQIRLADVYVHYDDAILPLSGGLTNRVKIKTANGSVWMTVPILRPSEQLINEIRIHSVKNWKIKHLKTLRQSYAKATYVNEMLDIVKSVYDLQTDYLMELNIFALEQISAYFGFDTKFELSSKYKVTSKSSEKVVELVKMMKSDVYITGHGAFNYLDHELFEKNGVKVQYMDYKRTPYPQLYGTFDPHVSILDLIANVGVEGRAHISSGTVYWKDFIHESQNI